MGKGDKKTKKEKRFKKSYGNARKKKHNFSVLNVIPKQRLGRVKIINNKGIVDSNLINQVVFPILSYTKEKGYYFLGTGFFINENGWFITAKHVVIDNRNKPINPFIVVQIINDKEYIIRQVQGFWYHPTADVCICSLVNIIYEGEHLNNPTVIFKKSSLKKSDKIFTYAYPDSGVSEKDGEYQIGEFSPKYYHGDFIERIKRNDSLFKGEILQTSIDVKHGASGGPVFDENGYVCGVNSTGWDLIEGDPLSFITPIEYAYDVEVRMGIDKLKLAEIAALGGIHFE